MITSTARSYRGVRRIGDTRDLWSAPAKRSGYGALTVPARRAERAQAGSRFACPRTPKLPVPQPNVAHPTVPSVTTKGYGIQIPSTKLQGSDVAGRIGIWRLGFLWFLELGFWCFVLVFGAWFLVF